MEETPPRRQHRGDDSDTAGGSSSREIGLSRGTARADSPDSTSTSASSTVGGSAYSGAARASGKSTEGKVPVQASCGVDDVPRSHLVAALACVLGHMASLGKRPQRTFCFHASRIPQLSVSDYLLRLSTYFGCSDQCLVLGLVYIDRIVKRHPEFVVSPWSIHRLLMTSIMVAAKFWDDVYYSNSHYARVGGVKLYELNMLEEQFLQLNGWRLHVVPDEYFMYQSQVLLAAQGNCKASLPERPTEQAGPPSLAQAAAQVQRACGHAEASATPEAEQHGVPGQSASHREEHGHGECPSTCCPDVRA